MAWFSWRKRPLETAMPDAIQCALCGGIAIPLVGLISPTSEYRLRRPAAYCRGCDVITTDTPTLGRARVALKPETQAE